MFTAEILYNVVSLQPIESLRLSESGDWGRRRSQRALAEPFFSIHGYAILRARVEVPNGFISHLPTLVEIL